MKPSASRQGGTVATPQDPLSLAIEAANLWKAASNDAFAAILTELAKARTELAEARRELERVAGERDAAREALAELREGVER